MKYSELINFEPIEDIIQLGKAKEDSEVLIKTYVVSERMSERINYLMIPNLNLKYKEDKTEKKGLLIIGNYGTGKSHLMSVISLIAENTDLLKHLKNVNVKNNLLKIASKFKVIRLEIGAVTNSLRNIICDSIEKFLKEDDINFKFKSLDKISSNKDEFIRMMGTFEQKYPEFGLLIVVDELLDFLSSRKDNDFILDINFLREIGELCNISKFRFIGGLQEALFDNPRFQSMANRLRRVKDRFEQIKIERQDISYVVSERLLKKTDENKKWIENHLKQFTPLYTNMSEKLEEFVNLFPIHPTFLEIFERIYIAEKRIILKTISQTIKKLFEKDIAKDEPCIISYDVYWNYIKEDPSLRAVPSVEDVIDKSRILEERVSNTINKSFRDAALKIINALSVHKLTTGEDVTNSRIGITSEEIKDGLCLYLDIPEKESDFLKTSIETILEEIKKSVNGQFITFNKDNGQYFLDLKKDIDYEARIEQRKNELDDDKLNRYYYNSLVQVLECSDDTYVTGFKIWEYEVIWNQKKVGRLGYLFFGSPDERSTAQPPRDFYVYFTGVGKNTNIQSLINEKKQDEVFFILNSTNEEFINTLELFAASGELSLEASGEARKIYKNKKDDYFRKLSKWIKENITTAYDVVYKGQRKKLIERITGSTARLNTKDIVNNIASICFDECFRDLAPEYPEFSTPITSKNITDTAKEAIKWIIGNKKTELGAKILDALNLLDAEKINPKKSKYAQHIVEMFQNKGKGQVINRSDIIEKKFEGIEYDKKFRLEPEWIVVILASLVYTGEIILSIPGNKIDASKIEDFLKNFDNVKKFKHIEKPKGLPLNTLIALCELLGIPTGLMRNESNRDEAVRQMQEKDRIYINKIIKSTNDIQDRLPCWGTNLLDEETYSKYNNKLTQFKEFLEAIQRYNTVGKLKNLKYSVEEINTHKKALDILDKIGKLEEIQEFINNYTIYISKAELIINDGNKWLEEVDIVKNKVKEGLKAEINNQLKSEIKNGLDNLKKSYIKQYMDMHNIMRLDVNGDNKKKKIIDSKELKILNKIKEIQLLPKQELEDFKNELAPLETCFSLIENDLKNNPQCPDCKFNPRKEYIASNVAKPVFGIINSLENKLDDIYEKWKEKLIEMLQDPIINKDMELLEDSKKAKIKEFIKTGNLEKINNKFISDVNTLLKGFERVEIYADDISSALLEGTNPCTIDDFNKRFEQYIKNKTRGKDPSKVRIILTKENKK